MTFLICLPMVEKVELNIFKRCKSPQFSQFNSITMFITHNISLQSEQKKTVEDRTNLDQPQPASFCCL